MTANKSIDSAAAAKLPAVTATPQFMSGAQSTKAASYLAMHWAQAVR